MRNLHSLIKQSSASIFSKKIQHLRELVLELTCTLQLPFIYEVLGKIGCQNFTKLNIPRRGRHIVMLLSGPPFFIVHCPICSDELQSAVQIIQFLQDNHLLFSTINRFCGKVVDTMQLQCVVHGHLWIRTRPIRSLP